MMTTKLGIRSAVVALGMLAFGAASAPAQVFTPTYMSPTLTSDVGIYVSDMGGLGVEGIWRRGTIGLRAGFADVGDGALMLGGEIRNPIVLAGAPIGLAITAGAQALVGDANGLGVQAGFSLGHRFVPQGSNLTVTPYLHPRIGLVNYFGGDDAFDMDVLADVGFDLDFAPNLSLRFGANLGQGPADWGIGVAWR